MDHFISMYIDNELSLEEKILFLEQVRKNDNFALSATTLLEQEKTLQSALKHHAPSGVKAPLLQRRFYRSLGLAAAACFLAVLSFLVGLHGSRQEHLVTAGHPAVPHRFVIHAQQSSSVEITGSFTKWDRVPLHQIGTEDYWEVVLPLPPGEHRYSFILNGTTLLPDPTVTAREADDFGTVNSILSVEV